MQCNSLTVLLSFDALCSSVSRFQCMCLATCRLWVSSLHGCSTHICAHGVMSHFHGIASFSDNIRACCGATDIFFYPKCLPNVWLCIAPCFGILGCVLASWGAQEGTGPNCWFYPRSLNAKGKSPRVGQIGVNRFFRCWFNWVLGACSWLSWLSFCHFVSRRKKFLLKVLCQGAA